jgi:uncharacterized SAM-binding protein YcdF (DUF218 family)
VLATMLVVMVACGGLTARLFIWPSLPPVPDQADAIFILGGPNMRDRDRTALRLAEAGVAPIVVKSTIVDEVIYDNCLRRVPGVEVLCIHPEPFTTRGEARALADLAEERGWDSVIIITTPDHAWRANVRVGRCYDGAVYTVTSHLPRSMWPGQIIYQWAATVKAFTYELSC